MVTLRISYLRRTNDRSDRIAATASITTTRRDATIENHTSATVANISFIIEQLERRLDINAAGWAEGTGGRLCTGSRGEARDAIRALEAFYPEVSQIWKERENRILGHVLSRPIVGNWHYRD